MRPNDGECHLNETGFYTHSTLQDYPSISFVNYLAKQNSVSVIWAVTQVLADFEYMLTLLGFSKSNFLLLLSFILGKDWSVQTVDKYGGGIDGRCDL